MYEHHPLLPGIEDPDAPIWRYLTFAKLVDLLDRRELWFSQLAAFVDPWEGMPAVSTLEESRKTWEYVHERVRDEQGVVVPPHTDAMTVSNYESFRILGYVNCWHINEYESMAMWNEYSHEGIAIKSSFSRLVAATNAVTHQISIAPVSYRDRRKVNTHPIEDHPFSAAFKKEMSYEHERELRAHFLYDARPEGDLSWHPIETPKLFRKGMYVGPIDLDALVESVHVSPGRPQWFAELVERVMQKYELPKPVERSAIDDRPNFT